MYKALLDAMSEAFNSPDMRGGAATYRDFADAIFAKAKSGDMQAASLIIALVKDKDAIDKAEYEASQQK